MVLKDEQRQMVIDNEKLIYWCMHRYNLLQYDDAYSILAIGLCKAAYTYSEEQGKFSTWAILLMLQEIKLDIRRNNSNSRKIQKYCTSLNTTMKDHFNHDSDVTLSECIVGSSDVWSDMITVDFSKLTKREQEIMSLIISGYTQKEMEKILGISQSYISRLIAKIKNKLGGMYYNEL